MDNRFNIDDDDFFSIQMISQGIDDSWEIAKKKYELDNSIKLKKDISRIVSAPHERLKKRLKKMSCWGLINISKEKQGRKKNQYNLIKEHFKIGKHKFPDGYFDSIQLKINDSWVIFQK